MGYREDISRILQNDDFEQTKELYRTLKWHHQAAMASYEDPEEAWDVVLRLFGVGKHRRIERNIPLDDQIRPDGDESDD